MSQIKRGNIIFENTDVWSERDMDRIEHIIQKFSLPYMKQYTWLCTYDQPNNLAQAEYNDPINSTKILAKTPKGLASALKKYFEEPLWGEVTLKVGFSQKEMEFMGHGINAVIASLKNERNDTEKQALRILHHLQARIIAMHMDKIEEARKMLRESEWDI